MHRLGPARPGSPCPGPARPAHMVAPAGPAHSRPASRFHSTHRICRRNTAPPQVAPHGCAIQQVPRGFTPGPAQPRFLTGPTRPVMAGPVSGKTGAPSDSTGRRLEWLAGGPCPKKPSLGAPGPPSPPHDSESPPTSRPGTPRVGRQQLRQGTWSAQPAGPR